MQLPSPPDERPLSLSRDTLRFTTAIRLAVAAFRRDNASRFGAALAFYVLFSLAPTLLMAIAVLGLAVGKKQAELGIVNRISSSFGSATGAAVATMLKDAAHRAGWLAALVALSSLYFGVTGVYRQIDDAIRTIWQGPRDGEAHNEPSRRRELLVLLAVPAAGVVVIVSVIIDAGIAASGQYAATRLIGGEIVWHIAELVASAVVLTVVFALIFRLVPNVRVPWPDVYRGAASTAALFVVGKTALALYLGKAAVGSAFGAAGSVVVVLLWTYWSAQIFFFGLELTHVYASGEHARVRSGM
jgi:membrane protein